MEDFDDWLAAFYRRFDEDLARMRRDDPATYQKVINRVRRNVTRARGRKAAAEHLAMIEADIDAAEAKLTPPAGAGNKEES